MQKLGLLTAAAVLATAVGFIGTAKAGHSYPIETAPPASTENYWKTSSFLGSAEGSTYVPELSEFDGKPSAGYVSDASVIGVTFPPSFPNPLLWEIFSGGDDSDNRFLYSTYIKSDRPQTLEIVIAGDDGHSLYVDGVLVGGGGFGVGVVFDLDLAADEAVKLDLVGANAGGPWNFQIGVDQQVLVEGI